jgi:hypothetical protein
MGSSLRLLFPVCTAVKQHIFFIVSKSARKVKSDCYLFRINAWLFLSMAMLFSSFHSLSQVYDALLRMEVMPYAKNGD